MPFQGTHLLKATKALRALQRAVWCDLQLRVGGGNEFLIWIIWGQSTDVMALVGHIPAQGVAT